MNVGQMAELFLAIVACDAEIGDMEPLVSTRLPISYDSLFSARKLLFDLSFSCPLVSLVQKQIPGWTNRPPVPQMS